MKPKALHGWDLSPEAARAVQRRLKSRLKLRPYTGIPRYVAGADLSFHPAGRLGRRRARTAWGCVILYEAQKAGGGLELREIERVFHEGRLLFPYVPGLLTFREGPILLKAFEKLSRRPDIVMFDAHGTAHPRGFGEACHLGLWLEVPSVGVAKSLLIGEGRAPGPRAGSWSPLRHRGKVVGAIVRTRDKTKPVYVSPGHLMDLKSARRLVMACAGGTRIPVPTREADRWSKVLRRRGLQP